MDPVFSNESDNVYDENRNANIINKNNNKNNSNDNEDGVVDVELSDDDDNDLVIRKSLSLDNNDGIDTVPVTTTGFVVHQLTRWREAVRSNVSNSNNGYWQILVAGQMLSFLLASTGAASATLHFECNLSAPTAQMGLVYLLLSLRAPFRVKDHFFSSGRHDENDAVDEDNMDRNSHKSWCERWMNGWFRLKPNSGLSWYAYPGIALLDVEANYFTFLAFRYTTLNSVSIFDALAIPSAMIASRFILRTQYQRCHLMGALICMVGVTLNVLRDSLHNDDDDGDSDSKIHQAYPHQILGDIIAILGALLHGLRDVMTELTLHHLETADPPTNNDPIFTKDNPTMEEKQQESLNNTNEYLGMIGVFGTLISIVQSILLEQSAIREFFRRTPQVITALGAASSSNMTVAMLQRIASESKTDQSYYYFTQDEYNTSYNFPSDDDSLFLDKQAWWVKGNDEMGVGYVSKYTSMEMPTCSESSGLWLLAAYVLATYLTYVGTSRFLIVSEAALLNLSLLTGDLWAVFFSVIAEHIMPQPLFWIALLLIMSGVLIYETGPSPTDHPPNTNHHNHHPKNNHDREERSFQDENDDDDDDDASIHSYHTYQDSEDDSSIRSTNTQKKGRNERRRRRNKKSSLSKLCQKKGKPNKYSSTERKHDENHDPFSSYVVFAEPDRAGGAPLTLPQELPRYDFNDTYQDEDDSYSSNNKGKKSFQKNLNRYRSRIRRAGNIVGKGKKSSNQNSSALWLNESHELELVVTV